MHASNLAREILKNDPEAKFRGIGGDHLEAVGATFLFPYNFLSFMGFFDTLIRLPRFLKAIKAVKRDIVAWEADAVIFVDFAAFNMRIVPSVVERSIPAFYYISPKVWAWNTGRARKIKRLVKNMFVILPFEKEFYQQFDYPVYYVGNPVKDAISSYQPQKILGTEKEQDEKTVALLPGSRKQEVLYSLQVFSSIIRKHSEVHFLVAAVPNLSKDMYEGVSQLQNVTVLENRNYDILSAADAALVTSGTATLETALLGVPQAVVYRTGAFNYAVASRLIKVDFISLVNLIAAREVVREMIQDSFNEKEVGDELNRLLYDQDYISTIKQGYQEVNIRLGELSPSREVARAIEEQLTENKNQ